MTNNGHTVQFQLANGSAITVAGRRYELLQAHFHEPSEHTVNGSPIRPRCISCTATPTRAGRGRRADRRRHGEPTLSTMWALPAEGGRRDSRAASRAASIRAGLLPKNASNYPPGSLTTPLHRRRDLAADAAADHRVEGADQAVRRSCSR